MMCRLAKLRHSQKYSSTLSPVILPSTYLSRSTEHDNPDARSTCRLLCHDAHCGPSDPKKNPHLCIVLSSHTYHAHCISIQHFTNNSIRTMSLCALIRSFNTYVRPSHAVSSTLKRNGKIPNFALHSILPHLGPAIEYSLTGSMKPLVDGHTIYLAKAMAVKSAAEDIF